MTEISCHTWGGSFRTHINNLRETQDSWQFDLQLCISDFQINTKHTEKHPKDSRFLESRGFVRRQSKGCNNFG